MEISLDKLPIKRLESIEENGAERFPSDVDYDDKRVSLIRRIDFAWAVEEEDGPKKKVQKKNSKESSGQQWQGMVENLRLAHQELFVILDLVSNVEANATVTVAGMTRPKPLPNEFLSDLAVYTATKLQSYRHLGKYFKQSAKALEQQISHEARFYGALIRLQRNWKVKRQRVVASNANSEVFTIDLSENSLYDSASALCPSTLSTIRVDHDSAGMLTTNIPRDSCHSLRFGFVGFRSTTNTKESSKQTASASTEDTSGISDSDEPVRDSHLLLREAHNSIFAEQLFDTVNREAFNEAVGFNLSEIRENYLQMSIGQGVSLFISLCPLESTDSPIDPSARMEPEEGGHNFSKKLGLPNHTSCEIYLQQIFLLEHVLGKGKDQPKAKSNRASNQRLLDHFCLSLAHRIFSNRVLVHLESVVCRVPYLHLTSHPTWNSRTSSWTVLMNVPSSIISSETKSPDGKNNIKPQFRTRVDVIDDCITIRGDCPPNVVGFPKGSSCNLFSINEYNCDLADLPLTILQQVASQILCWIREEARKAGVNTSSDFLSLAFEIGEGERVRLVADLDPEDEQGCISWWLMTENGASDASKAKPEIRELLGNLSLDVLYSALMDLISLCGGPDHLNR